jgi:hypothetical protein
LIGKLNAIQSSSSEEYVISGECYANAWSRTTAPLRSNEAFSKSWRIVFQTADNYDTGQEIELHVVEGIISTVEDAGKQTLKKTYAQMIFLCRPLEKVIVETKITKSNGAIDSHLKKPLLARKKAGERYSLTTNYKKTNGNTWVGSSKATALFIFENVFSLFAKAFNISLTHFQNRVCDCESCCPRHPVQKKIKNVFFSF